MRKAIAPTIVGLIIAGAVVFFITACAMFRSDHNPGPNAANQYGQTYHGKIHARPMDAESHYLMGCVFQKRKKHHLALEEFKRAVQIDPGHAAAYNRWGVSLDARGEYGEAVAAYTAALAIDRNLADVHNNLGYSYLLQGRFESSIQSLQKAVALDGDNQRYLNNLGLAYAKNGHYEDAFKAFSANGDENRAHLNIARLYYRNGLYEQAALHYCKAAAEKPYDSETRKGLTAATSLAQIHATKSIEKEAHSAHSTDKQIVLSDDDSFYTIPAGAIETVEFAEIDQADPAKTSYNSGDQKDETIHTASVAHIAAPEQEREIIEEALEAKNMQIFNETGALDILSRETADMEKHSKPRIKIEVSNGNGVRYMARRVGNYLRGKGFILMYLSNASHFNYEGTSIFYTSGYLRQAYRLSQELPGLQSLEEVSEIKDGNAEICIRIGRDLTHYSSLFEQG